MRRFIAILLTLALLTVPCSAETGLPGFLSDITGAASQWLAENIPVDAMLQEAMDAVSGIEEQIFADRPIPEIFAEFGMDAQTGLQFADFLSAFFETEIRTGLDLQNALTGWMQDQGVMIDRLANELLLPLLGASAFCLYMLFGGGVLTLVGEMSPEDYAVLRTSLAEGMRSLAADLGEKTREIINP